MRSINQSTRYRKSIDLNSSLSLPARMTQTSIIYILLVVVMLAGTIGAVIPILPGPTLIVAAIAVAGYLWGWQLVMTSLIVSVFVLAACFMIDYLSGVLGAQKAGASNLAQTGALVGLILGTLGLLPALPFGGPILGLFFGPFAGASIGEFFARGNLELPERLSQSLRTGVGLIVGSLLGLVMQGALCCGATATFVLTTISVVWK